MTIHRGSRAAVYTRISSDRAGAGLGVARQESDCRDLADAQGMQVVGVYSDNDISAYSGKTRPQYLRLLADIKAGHLDVVICWHTDRLHRSPIELEEYISLCQGRDVRTHTVKGGELDLRTPEGMLRAGLLGQVARYESAHKSQRITRKKLELAKSGAFSGGPVPYGWHLVDGVPVVVETDAIEIRRATTAVLAGRSIGGIVRDLNDRGVKTRRGQQWTSTSVRNLVNRPRNAGLSVYRGEVIGTSVFPAIVSEDEYWAVKALLENPARRTQTSSRIRHLLAGLVHCGVCRAPLKSSSRGRERGNNNERVQHYYKCPTPGPGHVSQTMEPLETLVARFIVRALSSAEAAERLTARDDRGRLVALQSEAENLRVRLNAATDSCGAGQISLAQLARMTESINRQLDAVTDALGSIQTSTVAGIVTGSAEAVDAWWEQADIEQRRATINALCTVYIDPVRVSAPRRFDADRVRFEWKVGV